MIFPFFDVVFYLVRPAAFCPAWRLKTMFRVWPVQDG
jgi:hypothetical protein